MAEQEGGSTLVPGIGGLIMLSRLVILDVSRGAAMESQSGIQALNPRIYGRLEEPQRRGSATAYVVIHPTNNFMGHYLIEPVRDRGARSWRSIPVMSAATRRC